MMLSSKVFAICMNYIVYVFDELKKMNTHGKETVKIANWTFWISNKVRATNFFSYALDSSQYLSGFYNLFQASSVRLKVICRT